MKLESLRDLFVHHIQDIHSAETQITKALPKLIKKAQSPDLRKALQDHLKETENQIVRLESIAQQMDFSSKGPKCKGMEGILAEGDSTLSDVTNDELIDAAIIGSAQNVEHYEIASYGTAKSFAETLGESDAAALLEESLDEEKAADAKLTELAEAGINETADEDENGEDNGASTAAATKPKPKSTRR